MSDTSPYGRITSGLTAKAAAFKTLDFIARNLAAWRDDSERPHSDRERDLNSQLCKFLNVMARRSGFDMVHFHHEEGQGAVHSADISANPLESSVIEGRTFSKYDPLIVLEGKRLPTPGSGREREYLTSPLDSKPGGGVQRFKMGLHGQELSIAGMVAYVQDRTCPHWFSEINNWIGELATSQNSSWSRGDRLDTFHYDSESRASRCESTHNRDSGVTSTIHLTHLWVEM